jgi:serine/threonine-protein kinase HipA
MNRRSLVYMELQGANCLVGTLWTRQKGGRESATFEYSRTWLDNPANFALEPALPLGAGPYHTPQGVPLFGALSDSAPDRWGRVLMRRADRRVGTANGRAPRTLQEIDYLLQVHDVSRLGALRFAKDPDGPFLAESKPDTIPPLVSLPRLLSASEHVINEDDSDEDLRLLLAPGSSLGGARPKASVQDADGSLALAKFPSPTDEWQTERWEWVALKLAAVAGIAVPKARLEGAAGKSVLLLQRFDRAGQRRIPFFSAMSMLGARDHETRCYLEIVDAIRRWGACPKEDMVELFRRMVFNILISNTDDHLRNHGFLHTDSRGWRLAPAYDLNPVPVDVKPRVLATEIDIGNATASLDLALEVAAYFELDLDKAHATVRQVGSAVTDWRTVATSAGIPLVEIRRMASAFEHDDLAMARRMTG